MAIHSFFYDNGTGWAMGFHTDESCDENKMIKPEEDEHLWINLAHVSSWFPGLSIISGVYYLHKANEGVKDLNENPVLGKPADHDELLFAKALKVRAIASFCQAGTLLFVADVIATTARFFPCSQKKEESEKKENLLTLQSMA